MMPSQSSNPKWLHQSSSLLAQLGWASVTTLRSPAKILKEVVNRIQGKETSKAMCEKLGLPSVQRPPGKLVWFCAQSVAEVAVLLPVVHRCLLERRDVNVLLTTCAGEAHTLLSAVLPVRVILQYCALDAPINLSLMVGYWKPDVAIFVESDLSPNIVECLNRCNSRLVLLNARLSPSKYLRWHSSPYFRRIIMARMLSRFDLIVPQSEVDVGRFRMLGATIQQMPGWCADLNYAASMGACVWEMWRPSGPRVMDLRKGVAGRPLWLAVSTHEGEEVRLARVHCSLASEFRHLLTIVVPRDASRCPDVKRIFEEQGLKVESWSKDLQSYENMDVMVVGDVGELPLLYAVSEIAFVGGSLLEGQEGHNLAEAAVTGCAVLVGKHAGQFNRMADELNEAAIMAAEEAAEVVNSSGFGNSHEEIQLEDAHNSQAGPSNSVPRSPVVDESYFMQEESSICLRSEASDSRLARPATAPAAVAYQWEFEPWPELQGRLGDPGWLGNERSTSRQSSVGNATSHSQRRHPDRVLDDRQMVPEEQGVTHGRVERTPSSTGLNRPARFQGSSGSPLPVQEQSASDPVIQSPHHRSEGHVKECLDAVPEAALDSPVSSNGIAADPNIHGVYSQPLNERSASGPASRDWVSRSPEQGSASASLTAPMENNIPFLFEHTPRSVGATVDGGLWRGAHSLVYASAPQQSDGRSSSPTRGQQICSTASFDASFRFAGQYILPATHLPYSPHGPAVWRVDSSEDLAFAVSTLLKEPLERRSRGHAAAQAAAKLATGLVSTVWSVMEDMVLAPTFGPNG